MALSPISQSTPTQPEGSTATNSSNRCLTSVQRCFVPELRLETVDHWKRIGCRGSRQVNNCFHPRIRPIKTLCKRICIYNYKGLLATKSNSWYQLDAGDITRAACLAEIHLSLCSIQLIHIFKRNLLRVHFSPQDDHQQFSIHPVHLSSLETWEHRQFT
jgi:hypothetical protein